MVLCKSTGILCGSWKKNGNQKKKKSLKKPSPGEVKDITSASQRLPFASYAKNRISSLNRPHLPHYHVDIPEGPHLHLIFFPVLPFGHVMCHFSFKEKNTASM